MMIDLVKLSSEPHVLLRLMTDKEGGVCVNVSAGGGITEQDEVILLMLAVIENITGIDSDAYVAQINMARYAASLPLLPRTGQS